MCSTQCHYPHRFSVSFSYYGLSLGADSLSDNLYVSCALMGLVELPGKLVCTQAIDRLVIKSKCSINFADYKHVFLFCGNFVILCSYGRKISLVSSLLLTGIACICSGAVQWTSQCK